MAKETLTFRTARFRIVLEALPEFDSPYEHFDAEDEELCAAIENGDYPWYCAHVSLYVDDMLLHEDFLGCCWDELKEFRRDIFFRDMVRQCVYAARKKINSMPKLRLTA